MKKLLVSLICFSLTMVGLSGQSKQKIIFDCDLGDDIDDAFALAMVITSPEFEILGIVMDRGEA